MEYNTSRERLSMPEYGRNIQMMVNYLKTITDAEKRQKNAEAIIELMGVLNPHLRNVEDFKHKLWHHLFIIADFDLDVKSPYPIPSREKLLEKPQTIPYPAKNIKNKHLGRNFTAILEKAMKETDEEKRGKFAQILAYYMKLSYANWHKEPAQDETIREELEVLSGGLLSIVPGGSSYRIKYEPNKHGYHKKNAARKNNNSRNGNQRNTSFTNGQNNSYKKIDNRRKERS